jgi:hypothetical protein
MKVNRLALAALTLLIAKSAYPQLRDDFPLPPSPCDSDYLEAAKNKYIKLLDVTDEVVPTVSPAQIAEFEETRSQINQYCHLAPMGLPLEIGCDTHEHFVQYQPLWQKLTDDTGYMAWTIHKEVAFQRSVPATFDRFTHTDNIDALFNYIEGDIWLLDQLGGYYGTLKRLQVGQPKLAETFLADMKHVSVVLYPLRVESSSLQGYSRDERPLWGSLKGRSGSSSAVRPSDASDTQFSK